MGYNIFKGYEILFTKRNADGSPITSPALTDMLLLDYTQSVRLARIFEDAVVTKNEGPNGTVCRVTKKAKLIGSTLGLQLAQLDQKLAYFFEGGSYNSGTGKHTPPLQSDAAPVPFSVEAYVGYYADDNHDVDDLAGYLKISLPKCVGSFQELTADLTNFANPNVTINSEEYIDGSVPANSEPCYDIDVATELPSEADYAVDFLIQHTVEAALVDLIGVLVSVTVDGVAVTDTTDVDGVAELALPLGTHTYTLSKTGYTDKTGEVTVTMIGASVTDEIIATG